MVLDSLGVHSGNPLADPDRKQKPVDHIVPFTTMPGEAAAFRGERDRLAWLGDHQAIAAQATDDLRCGDVSDAELFGEWCDPALAVALDQVEDRLNVVLRGLGSMVAAGALEALAVIRVWQSNVQSLIVSIVASRVLHADASVSSAAEYLHHSILAR